MNINATLINLFHVCKREMWLHANGIRMEHTSETVAEGKLLHETSYPQRAGKYTEIEIGGSKIDFYNASEKIIHEIKKSNKVESAHEWQLKYYILILEQHGIPDVDGILEYPKIRETKRVKLSENDREYLNEICTAIQLLIDSDICPPRIKKSFCKSCSYYDFCWVQENAE